MSRGKKEDICKDALDDKPCDGVVLVTLWQIVHHITHVEEAHVCRVCCVVVTIDRHRV